MVAGKLGLPGLVGGCPSGSIPEPVPEDCSGSDGTGAGSDGKGCSGVERPPSVRSVSANDRMVHRGVNGTVRKLFRDSEMGMQLWARVAFDLHLVGKPGAGARNNGACRTRADVGRSRHRMGAGRQLRVFPRNGEERMAKPTSGPPAVTLRRRGRSGRRPQGSGKCSERGRSGWDGDLPKLARRPGFPSPRGRWMFGWRMRASGRRCGG